MCFVQYEGQQCWKCDTVKWTGYTVIQQCSSSQQGLPCEIQEAAGDPIIGQLIKHYHPRCDDGVEVLKKSEAQKQRERYRRDNATEEAREHNRFIRQQYYIEHRDRKREKFNSLPEHEQRALTDKRHAKEREYYWRKKRSSTTSNSSSNSAKPQVPLRAIAPAPNLTPYDPLAFALAEYAPNVSARNEMLAYGHSSYGQDDLMSQGSISSQGSQASNFDSMYATAGEESVQNLEAYDPVTAEEILPPPLFHTLLRVEPFDERNFRTYIPNAIFRQPQQGVPLPSEHDPNWDPASESPEKPDENSDLELHYVYVAYWSYMHNLGYPTPDDFAGVYRERSAWWAEVIGNMSRAQYGN